MRTLCSTAAAYTLWPSLLNHHRPPSSNPILVRGHTCYHQRVETRTPNTRYSRFARETTVIDVVCVVPLPSGSVIAAQIKMAAEADEPPEQNFVRKHALEQAKEFGLSVRDAATRVFSNAAGSYSANVGLAIENGGWEGEEQLQQQFVARKGFAFNADKPGMMEAQVSRRRGAVE